MYLEPTDYDIRQLLVEQGIKFVDLPDRFQIVCPYHDDHAPSAVLYKDRQFFECFACGKRRFFKTMYREFKHKNWEDDKELNLVRPKLRAVELSVQMRREVEFEDGVITSVYDNPKALAYCRSRGVKDSFIDYFGLMATEVCRINGKMWDYRLLIPVQEDGKDYSMEGRDYYRDLDSKKCLYPKDAPIDTLFNVDNLNPKEPLVVVEGVMDLHKIWQDITQNVTATFGIMITRKQQELLRDRDIILFIDNDEAGRKSIGIFEKFMRKDFKVAIVRNRKDPGDATVEELKKAIAEAVPYGKFLVEDLGLFPKQESLSLSAGRRNYNSEGTRER